MAISGLAVDRRIVEHEFAVERDHAAIAEQRQRIDLQQLGVVRAIGPVKLIENARDLRFRPIEIEAFEHAGDVGR